MKYFKTTAIIFFVLIYVIIIVYNISMNHFLFFIISIPVSCYIVLTTHEIAHLICFKLFGCKVSELRIGIMQFNIKAKHISIHLHSKGIFTGYCKVTGISKIGTKKTICSLVMGGLSSLMLFIGSTFIIISSDTIQQTEVFFIALSIVSLISLWTTLINPRSADNKAIKKLCGGNIE